MKRIVFLLIASLVFAGLAFAGGSREAAKDGPVVINVWFGREEMIPDDAFETFHAENPGIRVEWDVMPLEQSTAEYLRNFRFDTNPDIVQILHSDVPQVVNSNALMDMSAYVDQWRSDDPDGYNSIVSVGWEMASWDGAIYGLNTTLASFPFSYRQDWLDEAGLQAPKTWDEVLEVGKALRDNYLGSNQYAYSIIGGTLAPPFWWQAQLLSMGIPFEDGIPVIDSETGRYMIELWQTFMKEGLVHPDTISWNAGEHRGAFIGGNTAMAVISDNIFPRIGSEFGFGREWGASALPYRPGADAEAWPVSALGYPYMVSANTDHPAEAFKVLQYLASTDNATSVALRYMISTNKEVYSQPEYLDIAPWGPMLQEVLANAAFLPRHINQPGINEILNDLKQESLMNLDGDPAEIAARYQELLNAFR